MASKYDIIKRKHCEAAIESIAKEVMEGHQSTKWHVKFRGNVSTPKNRTV